MKATLSIRLHAATLIVACILALRPLYNDIPFEQFVGRVIATIVWLVVYYLFFSYLTPVYLLSKRFVPFLSISFIVLLILPFIGYSLVFHSKAIFQGAFANLSNLYSLQMKLSGFKTLALAGLLGSYFRLIVECCGASAK